MVGAHKPGWKGAGWVMPLAGQWICSSDVWNCSIAYGCMHPHGWASTCFGLASPRRWTGAQAVVVDLDFDWPIWWWMQNSFDLLSAPWRLWPLKIFVRVHLSRFGASAMRCKLWMAA